MQVMEIDSYHGWRFCPFCNNQLKPYGETEETDVMLFKCRSDRCGNEGIIRVRVDPGEINQALLLKKDYQAAKQVDITNTCLILDPSMPRERIRCLVCNFDEAIYFLKTDKNEREIIIQYMCANKDFNKQICGNMWTNQNKEYFR